MFQPAALESVVELASTMRDVVTALYEAFAQMPVMIEQEHEAIRSGKLSNVEQVMAQKVALGEVIEAQHMELKRICDRLSLWCQMNLGSSRFQNMSQVVDAFDAIVLASPERSLHRQVIAHLAKAIRTRLEQFSAAAKAAKPSLEVNRIVVEKAIRNHQESWRFWQNVAAESSATYNATGVPTPAGNGSILQVRT